MSARSSTRMLLLVVRDGRCAPIRICTPGASARIVLASIEPQAQAASRDRGSWASSISFARSNARIAASPAKAPAHVCASTAWERRMTGSEKRSPGRPCASSIQAGHQMVPLMLRTMSVGTTLSPVSAAARTTSTSRAIMPPSTVDGAGRKSLVRANTRTTSKPRSAMCVMSSRTSPMSKSSHMYIALRRGQ